jgi:phosphopentomutase
LQILKKIKYWGETTVFQIMAKENVMGRVKIYCILALEIHTKRKAICCEKRCFKIVRYYWN